MSDVAVAEFVCDECGEPKANAAGLAAHKRSHKGKPVVLPEWRQNPRMRVGIRSVTMLDPRCKTCQGEDNVAIDWYRNCTHDPYITVVPVKEQRPRLVDDPDVPGRKKVEGMDEFVSYVPRPNTREITLSMGGNAGNGVVWARRKGFILPSELRNDLFPNGIADPCQFYDCKKQTDLKTYGTWGTYCREEEAQLVWYYETGTTLEVGEWSNEARQNRMNMLKAAQV